MEKNQIRQAEIDELYALDIPELKPSTYSHNFAIFTIAFLFCLILLSLFINAPTSVDVVGKLVLKNPSIPVRALKSFTVNENNLVEEQYVAAGSVLVTSALGMNPNFLRQINQILERYERVANGAEDCAQCLVEATQIAASISSYAEASQFPDTLNLLISNRDNIKALAATMTTGRDDLRKSYARIEQIDKQLASKRSIASQNAPSPAQLQQTRAQSLAQYTELNQRYEKSKQTYLQYRDVIRKQNEAIKSRMADIQSRENIKAPIAGKITNVKVRGTGEFVQAGQVLFEIVPENSELIAQLEVSNRDIGQVKVGGSVDIAFDAYPEFDFGRMKGSIVKILEPEQTDGPQQNTQRGFRVQVELSAQQFRSKSKFHDLRNGMTLRSRIRGKETSLFMSFMKTIFKLKDDLRT